MSNQITAILSWMNGINPAVQYHTITIGVDQYELWQTVNDMATRVYSRLTERDLLMYGSGMVKMYTTLSKNLK